MSDFIAGLIVVVAVVIIMAVVGATASDVAHEDIDKSCELAGVAMINGKAYKCELIKSPN